ncbi:MAG: tripartite tricarboxylate transporter substrate binding protein [Xanthobacteraceae bacterium]|jgi:tripartite-type tricarboxylate transporter receptor subunit TctC
MCAMIWKAGGLLLLAGSLIVPAEAQPYPARPVTMIVPYAAGGATDLIARLTAQGLTAGLGQSFIVENRGGGGGMIGVQDAARATADGYTLLFSSTGPVTISPLLFKRLGFDPMAKLEPIVQVASSPAVLLVRKNLPVKSVDELIALSKKSPGSLNMASAGIGSLQHLIGELFQSKTGVKWTHVPFKGSGPAFGELIAERVDVMVDVIPAAAPLVQGGQVRALAVMAPKRSRQLADVPTLEELGFKGFDFSGWHAVFAPKGTPADVVTKINAAVNAFIQKPETQAQLEKMGANADGGTPAQLGERMRNELREWGEVIHNVGIVPEGN